MMMIMLLGVHEEETLSLLLNKHDDRTHLYSFVEEIQNPEDVKKKKKVDAVQQVTLQCRIARSSEPNYF